MPLHDFHQSFNSGELSPMMDSRANVEKYASGCLTLQNLLPLPHGPVVKRAGSVYMFGQESPSTAGRLHGFQFGGTNHAVAELSINQIRFIEGGAAVAGPYGTTWADVEAPFVKFAQVNNVIWAVHPDNAVTRITREAYNTYAVVNSLNPDYPPLLDENITDTTITPSATSGSITLTASASLFTSANVGSFFEIAQVRSATFAEVIMGDTAGRASKALTISATPADGDTVTLNGRVYTARSAGRDVADEIDIGDSADDFTDNLLLAINTGGGGAEPHATMEAEEIGGLKASGYFGFITNTNVADNDTVTIGDVTYKFQQASDDVNDPYEVLIGADLQASLLNLHRAINLLPVSDPDAADLDYFTRDSATGAVTAKHPKVESTGVTVTGSGYRINIRALDSGAGGNTIATTAVVGGSHTWGASTLTGGTRVLNIRAKTFGADGNALTIAESSSALAFAGGATTLSGGSDETDSASLTVLGKYEVRTNGRWSGILSLQQLRIDGVTWDTIHSWKSVNGDYNVLFEADVAKHTGLRLSFTGYGEKADNTWPRARLEPIDPFHRGIVKITAYTSATLVTATVVNALLSTSATKFWSEGAWSPRRGYPRAVCYHQNRIWFAGTTYEPSKLWASRLGDFENFRYDSTDEGALAFQLTSTNNQQILWLCSHHDLVIGTDMGAWTGSLADGNSAFSNTNPPVFREKDTHGSADVQAVVAGDSVIYVQKYGRVVRRLFHDGNDYVAGNLTLLSEHITENGITQLAVQTVPETIIWAICDSNYSTPDKALALTFEPEQNVFAWSKHPITGSDMSSVAVVYGSGGTEVWFLANVKSLGRSVLRLHPATHNRTNQFTINDIHVDCAVIKAAAAFTTVTLPAVLVGSTVWVKDIQSGVGVVTSQVAASTTLTVTESTSVIVGLPMVSNLQTMRLEYQMRDGTAQGRAVQVKSAILRLRRSQGGEVKASYTNATYQSATFPEATTTYTGEFPVTIAMSHKNSGTITVNHDKPWALTLTGLILRAEIGTDPAYHYSNSDG